MNIMKSMMLSCDKATELMEKKVDFGLTLTERLKLKLHTGMCDACANYQKQTALIHQLLQKQIGMEGYDQSAQHPAVIGLKAEIIRRLDKTQ